MYKESTLLWTVIGINIAKVIHGQHMKKKT